MLPWLPVKFILREEGFQEEWLTPLSFHWSKRWLSSWQRLPDNKDIKICLVENTEKSKSGQGAKEDYKPEMKISKEKQFIMLVPIYPMISHICHFTISKQMWDHSITSNNLNFSVSIMHIPLCHWILKTCILICCVTHDLYKSQFK